MQVLLSSNLKKNSKPGLRLAFIDCIRFWNNSLENLVKIKKV